ncbi:transmembrane ascorbate-dependent reductase CYB561-like isoform X2 [Uloborus diversus]|uniref:transmembrane ascorbate-dependent reductase CYB561-like isoform X2 n=1 Tax=Uloborus diversus TaxID=327109 RepID=UPI0024098F03|nr:transmembrane ascorbate-dependent reductase CYB561-like isoform X2 [Uloborus diversus]XP_054716495.1 transmembrane ascorbate-dependent reductase CYB561-like isoform X2 [Uloborus diversus]XP_054716496.1 transmembrane ascorbate-dependent reductase CYB561-like isoform X2 [Uloborus diversus]XP_054716497.1 transmembrane ascorbate-dependent reductase CYB561-like isoform X2 [Uloborus diversus]XP_054716498.1 transmembrane ascorbate-dependent reductase CYB561-like isoform X2 [Uloborus diversus]XP_05
MTGQRGMDSPSLDEGQELGYFKVWLLISQLLGVICIALVSAWCGQYLGGFAWQSQPALQFNYHPFFMVLGLIFCYGDALLVYRVFRNQRKRTLKLLHLGLHTLAFIFAIVALKAAFDSHNLAKVPIPNLYSVHSWLGITAVVLFAMQYLFGFVAFLFPGLTKIWRAKYLPVHVFFGLFIFVMCVAAALMGITEKLIFSLNSTYKERPTPAVIGNLLGYCLIFFALLVVYLVATPQFRRRLLPEEVQLQLEQHSPH